MAARSSSPVMTATATRRFAQKIDRTDFLLDELNLYSADNAILSPTQY
jgi:hypothetical protein